MSKIMEVRHDGLVADQGLTMVSWGGFEAAEPDLAARIRERLEAHVHKTIATLMSDGSPRISGTEAVFGDGEIWIGSMPRSRKGRDLKRDPRYALHSGSEDPPEWPGDAKLSGRAVLSDSLEDASRAYGEGAPDPDSFDLFNLQIGIATHVGLNSDREAMVIEMWTPDRGLRTIHRD